tara:strand:+ start:87 stop:680 length:594 start_codon:yes stop_codon:yes gene_type:complete
MKKSVFICISFVCFLIVTNCFSQQEEFNKQRYSIDKKLMLSLGSWASANIIGSGIGWATTDNQQNKYFHQMNVFWNAINLGLAIPGYIKTNRSKTDLSLFKTLDEQRKIEAIHLINAGLDLAYISSGLLLRNKTPKNQEEKNQFMGYGNSILIQGGFLLIYDWIAYAMHRRHVKKNLNPLLQKIEVSSSGIGLRFNL